ncbi:hypothetical protein [Streptomyces brasiliensis]|uniref:SWIM-type domain-containing protein n=1 Tax=Streptomyces brasiliensis TaxID=1954 RepID=A0A917L920_9ACTN|nr:hypothetical protein [Streptomyces brasiliensis]GGJ53085.1 hypothetical protein GCM10010121_074850 [Streptomyces brasiliensis]
MAAQVTAQTVRQTAGAAAFRTGEELHRQGAVEECDAADGGAAGVVAGREAPHAVWVGVADRQLVSACDCGSRDALCEHAVALALAAVNGGIGWYPAPQRDANRADAAAAFRALSAAERGSVLDALLAARPELLPEAQRLALTLLTPAGTPGNSPAATHRVLSALREDTAADVRSALLALDIDDLHTGYRPGFGYVEPHDAAGRLVEDALRPYQDDVTRRLGLGLTDAARAIALGVLDGLHSCEGSYDGDQVLCYAGEDLAATYGWGLREQFRKAGAPLPDTRPE